MIEGFSSLAEPVKVALISASGVVFSGVIASVIAWLGFWITFKTSTAANREVIKATNEVKALEIAIAAASKQAEFRQAWIENLRRAVANYLSDVVSIVDSVENKISSEKYEKCVFQTEYIELLLNMNESESKTLAEDMRQLFDAAARPFEHKNPKVVYAARQKVAESTRVILKNEWDKLRRELKTKQG